NVADGSVFYDIIFAANISDSGGGLIVSNSNPLGNFVIFRGSNSFVGPLTIDQTIISAETPWALGATNGGTIVKSNSTLWLYITRITNESVTLNAGAQLVGQYDCTWTGPITMTGDAAIQSFGGSSGYAFNLLGAVTGTGNLLMLTDGGNIRMSGSALNTYSGSTTFGSTAAGSGALELNRATFHGSIPHDFSITNGQVRLLQLKQINNGANVTMGASASLVLSNGVLERIGTLSGGGSVNLGASGNYIVVGDPSNNGSSTYNGLISGAGDLWKD